MAKLNKNEIEAVANKAHRALEEAAKAKRQEAINNYTPSERYKTMMQLVEERNKAEETKEHCRTRLSELMDSYNYRWHGGDWDKERYIRFIIEKECSLAEVPSKESIVDDVTIAAIDRDFDTAKFIENLVAKFNE